jgi:hypothetical protein
MATLLTTLEKTYRRVGMMRTLVSNSLVFSVLTNVDTTHSLCAANPDAPGNVYKLTKPEALLLSDILGLRFKQYLQKVAPDIFA